jgi:hypothetical protein
MMRQSESGGAPAREALRDVLDAIETLRLRRQTERKLHLRSDLKHFTQQELNDEACPTYKNLLMGRSLRVPSRQTILDIAGYLECTSTERNALLVAARYLPETLELTGSDLTHALDHTCHLMQTLPYPAMVVTHRLEIHAFNERFRRCFEIPSLDEIPRPHRHLFHFLFHPDLLIRMRSTFNTQAMSIWQAQAARGIQLFKRSNLLYQYEPWYQELIEEFCTLADFRTYWEQDCEQQDDIDVPSKLWLSRHTTTGELMPIQLKTVFISVGSHQYPGLVTFFPLDEAAQEIFAALDNEANLSTTEGN